MAGIPVHRFPGALGTTEAVVLCTVYRHACPPSDVRFETAVFLSHRDGRFNPGKPLHATFQKNRGEARAVITHLVEQVADGRLAFQSFFQR